MQDQQNERLLGTLSEFINLQEQQIVGQFDNKFVGIKTPGYLLVVSNQEVIQRGILVSSEFIMW